LLETAEELVSPAIASISVHTSRRDYLDYSEPLLQFNKRERERRKKNKQMELCSVAIYDVNLFEIIRCANNATLAALFSNYQF